MEIGLTDVITGGGGGGVDTGFLAVCCMFKYIIRVFIVVFVFRYFTEDPELTEIFLDNRTESIVIAI